MFIITGVSGTGKSTTIRRLKRRAPTGYAFHDVDDLPVPDNAGDWSREEGAEYWLQVAISNSQKGISTVLGGTLFPEDVETRPARAGAPPIHYLLFEADDGSIASRMTARVSNEHMKAELRRICGLSLEEYIPATLVYRQKLRNAFQNSACDWTSYDTSEVSEEETILFVLKWLKHQNTVIRRDI